MNWLRRALRRAPRVPAAQSLGVAEWRATPASSPRMPLHAARLVVVDVESSGLDARRDQLISIGAVAVTQGAIDFTQSFETVLRQAKPSPDDNILVHGIGGTEQCGGADPAAALISFLEFAGKDPLVAFHSDFDRAMIGRSLERVLGLEMAQPWLDLAYLAPAMLGLRAPPAKSLDDWLALYGIPNYARHNALADAVATAQLLLVVLAACARQEVKTVAGLAGVERDQRWLQRP